MAAGHAVVSYDDDFGGVFSTVPGATDLLLANRGPFEIGGPVRLYDVSGAAPRTVGETGMWTAAQLVPAGGGSILATHQSQDNVYEVPTPDLYPTSTQYDFRLSGDSAGPRRHRRRRAFCRFGGDRIRRGAHLSRYSNGSRGILGCRTQCFPSRPRCAEWHSRPTDPSCSWWRCPARELRVRSTSPSMPGRRLRRSTRPSIQVLNCPNAQDQLFITRFRVFTNELASVRRAELRLLRQPGRRRGGVLPVRQPQLVDHRHLPVVSGRIHRL